jgi:D-alanine-D-alanine ligase
VKPSITVLYDAEEETVRTEALSKGEPFPPLVCEQLRDALTRRGYRVNALPAAMPIETLMQRLASDGGDLVFNVCESLGGEGTEERRVASMLELLDKRFTGSGSLALTMAGDKSLAKKLFAFHGVRSPDFAIIAPGHIEGAPRLDRFPLIVKPIATDASIGIDARSVVHSVDEMLQRVFAVHEEFHTPALVEEFIDGREIYVGLLGNPLEALPAIEWDLSHLEEGLPRIAGTEAKWKNGEKAEARAHTEFVPDDLMKNDALRKPIEDAALGAARALLVRDYARVDLRVTADGTPYVIEVNPNPWLDANAELAMAARHAQLEYDDLVERIVQLAMVREIRARR